MFYVVLDLYIWKISIHEYIVFILIVQVKIASATYKFENLECGLLDVYFVGLQI